MQNEEKSEDQPMSSACLHGAGIGAVATPVIVSSAVYAAGFTSSGIAAGSTAAALMSAEALAAGGAIASGGLVATGQSIGASGLVASGMLAPAIGLGIVVGGAIGFASLSAYRYWQQKTTNDIKALDYQSGYDSIVMDGRWVLVTQEGWGNVRVYFFADESSARTEFENARTARILFNPAMEEQASDGFNYAFYAIRDAFRRNARL